MNAVYRFRTEELTPDFITVLKTLYPHREIEIVVEEVMKDETEYLLSSSANRLHLEAGIKNIENHINLVEMPFENIKS